MEHTTNYNLNLPEGSDNAYISVLSENFSIIDTTMKSISDDIQTAIYVDTDDVIIPADEPGV